MTKTEYIKQLNVCTLEVDGKFSKYRYVNHYTDKVVLTNLDDGSFNIISLSAIGYIGVG